MAQALVVAMSNEFGDMSDPNKVTLDWTSASGGTVSLAICSTYITVQGVFKPHPKKLQGFLRSIQTMPGASGDLATALPTTLYDITILDPYGYDISGGILADRSASVAEKEIPTEPLHIDSELTLTIANAGGSNKGRIILEIVPDAVVR